MAINAIYGHYYPFIEKKCVNLHIFNESTKT